MNSTLTHPMKTFFVIIATLMLSQILYVEYGPNNPVARVSIAATKSVRWFVNGALHLAE